MKTLFFFLLIISVMAIGYMLGKKHFSSENENVSVNKATWETTLPGSWNIMKVDSNDKETWIDEIRITFNPDHTFRLNGREKYYDDPMPRDAVLRIVSGGGAKGTWNTTDSTVVLKYSNCDIQESLHEVFTKAKIHFKCANDSTIMKFGIISNFDLVSKIIKINHNEILITGTNYTENYDLRCQFNKLEN